MKSILSAAAAGVVGLAACDSAWDDAPHCCAFMRFHNHASSCEWVPRIVEMAESMDEATCAAEYADLYGSNCDGGYYTLVKAYKECKDGKTP